MSAEESKWWWSALSAAKEKSVLAINATRRDLAEFVSVLQNDTASAISSVGTNLKGLVQPVAEQSKPSIDTVPRTMHDSAPQISSTGYDRISAKLCLMQNDPTTYLTVPIGEELAFSKWRETFDIQEHQTEISQLLVSAPHVRALHSQLVPARVSYDLFWRHYWFNTTRVKQEEEKRAQLVARVATKDEEWQWDDEPDNGSVVCQTQENLHEHRSESSESFVCVTDDGSGTNFTEQTTSIDPDPPTQSLCLESTNQDEAVIHTSKLQESPLKETQSQKPDTDGEECAENCSSKPSHNDDSDWEQWDD